MRVVVRHGHFAFYPQERRDALRFQRVFGLKLVTENDYFTFEGLKDLPRWSQTARPYGNLIALQTFEGRHASEVMAKNGFVFSLSTKLLVPYQAVTQILKLPQGNDYVVAPKVLVQPGSVLTTGNVLLGYTGIIDLDYQKLYIDSQETLL